MLSLVFGGTKFKTLLAFGGTTFGIPRRSLTERGGTFSCLPLYLMDTVMKLQKNVFID